MLSARGFRGAVGGAVQKHSKTVRDSGQDSLQVFPDGLGTAGEIEVFDGLSHGFGLGEGTVAEGWINRAVAFWEENTDQ